MSRFTGNIDRFVSARANCTICGGAIYALIGNFIGDTTAVVCRECRETIKVPTVLVGGRIWFDVDKAIHDMRGNKFLSHLRMFARQDV